ncbi:MAG: DNA repair protein RecN [Panacagrimonas sp.]
MLEHLHIRNLATIEELSIDFAPGFTVLTGETGAGKSILIDALGLVLGTRADPALVRTGSERAEISASFRLDDARAARDWLGEHELLDADDPSICLIRRVLGTEGRTRAFVNGQAAAAGSLRELGEHLVEVFGQSESHRLRRAEVQRDLLDSFGRHADLNRAVAAHALEWAELAGRIERLRAAAARDPAQTDYLRHQVRELAALNLKDGEIEQLDADHKRLANAGKLLHDGGLAQELLYGGDGSTHDQLAAILSRLRPLVSLHPAFADVENLVSSAQALTREAADDLRRLLEKLDLDPQRLADVEARLADVHDLARKHRVRADELPQRLVALQSELDEAEAAGGQVDILLRQQALCLAAYREASANLGAARRACAGDYGNTVTRHVCELGMPNAQFRIRVEDAHRPRPHSAGEDQIEFEFSANPGQPPRALAKVASGGELSRVSLAIQVVAQQVGAAPTLIFDEVDAGIGGAVAEAVGRQLRQVGVHGQVLSVTHLGQVAACGQQHLAVRKRVRDEQTFTQIDVLDGKSRVAELARMIGGQKQTLATETMARELLDQAHIRQST